MSAFRKYSPVTAQKILKLRTLHERLYFLYENMDRDNNVIAMLLDEIKELSPATIDAIAKDIV